MLGCLWEEVVNRKHHLKKEYRYGWKQTSCSKSSIFPVFWKPRYTNTTITKLQINS